MIGDLFPEVETPPWEDRFTPTGGWKGKVACVVCGATGYRPRDEADEDGYTKWWTRRHRRHVRCSCGQLVSAKGVGTHRASKRQHGDPCPPVQGAL